MDTRSNQPNGTNRMDICEGPQNEDGYDPKQIDGRYAMVKPRYTATNLMPNVTSCTRKIYVGSTALGPIAACSYGYHRRRRQPKSLSGLPILYTPVVFIPKMVVKYLSL